MASSPPPSGPARRRRRDLLALPSLLGSALRLVWSASPPRTVVMLALQMAASLSLFGQVVLLDQVLGVVLDRGSGSESVRDTALPVALLAALTAVTALAASARGLLQRMLGELVAREVWRRILDVTQTVELSTYDDPDFHDQAERVQSSAASQTQIVVQALVVFVGDALGVLAGTVAVVTIAPVLAPLLLLSAVPLIVVSRVSARSEFTFAVAQSWRDRERSYLQDVLGRREEAKEVRSFSLAPALRGRWEANVEEFLDDLRRHVGRRIRLALVGNVVAAVLTAGALLMALYLVDSGALSIASAGAALVAVRLLGSRVSGASLGLSTIFESSLFLRDLREFLGRVRVEEQPDLRPPAPAGFDRLTVSDVTFTYPGAALPSLQGLSLEVRRGEVIALVGENGSGKTTLAKLLANLYEPDEGAVCWDGADLREFEPDSVRRRMSVIFQDFIRYQFSARGNIALGRPEEDVDDETIRDAAQQADVDRLISSLPAGYDTILSKEYAGGTDLSGGQWQRIALARAFIRNAPFVILDEPTASIDARAEHELFERIRTLFAGRTVLLISHRFSTVRDADRIYVLSAGRVVEQGNHADLMEQGGLYADLFRLQASAYEDSAG
jgi:ATP-binding cassette, subfamily B, bacterial